MRYRNHKGGLKESLDTTKVFNHKTELLNYLNETHYSTGVFSVDLRFKYIGLDKRSGWDTYNVLFKPKGSDVYMVVGMSDGDFSQE